MILDVWSAFMGPVTGSRSLVYHKTVIYGKSVVFNRMSFLLDNPWFNTLIYGYLGSIPWNGTPLWFFKLVYWLFNKAKTLKVRKDLRCLVQIKSLLIASLTFFSHFFLFKDFCCGFPTFITWCFIFHFLRTKKRKDYETHRRSPIRSASQTEDLQQCGNYSFK